MNLRPVSQNKSYLVSDCGRIFSTVVYGRWKTGLREIKQFVNPQGYLKVRLRVDGRLKNLSVHRLVAQAFIPNTSTGSMVRHLDDNKTNNHFANLMWGTAKDNSADQIRNGRSGKGIKHSWKHKSEISWRTVLDAEQVRAIRERFRPGVDTFSSLGREHGVGCGAIRKLLYGQTWPDAGGPLISFTVPVKRQSLRVAQMVPLSRLTLKTTALPGSDQHKEAEE